MAQPKDDDVTFDEILSDTGYKAEFDRRVTKAIEKRQAVWAEEKKTEIDGLNAKIEGLTSKLTEKEPEITDLNKQISTGQEELNKTKFGKELDIVMSKVDIKTTKIMLVEAITLV